MANWDLSNSQQKTQAFELNYVWLNLPIEGFEHVLAIETNFGYNEYVTNRLLAKGKYTVSDVKVTESDKAEYNRLYNNEEFKNAFNAAVDKYEGLSKEEEMDDDKKSIFGFGRKRRK